MNFERFCRSSWITHSRRQKPSVLLSRRKIGVARASWYISNIGPVVRGTHSRGSRFAAYSGDIEYTAVYRTNLRRVYNRLEGRCVCVYTRYIFISSYCAASNIFHFEATLKFHVQSLFFVYSCSKVTEPNVWALRSLLLFPDSRNNFLRRKKEFHVISFVIEIFADFCPFSNEYIALIPKFKSMETKF